MSIPQNSQQQIILDTTVKGIGAQSFTTYLRSPLSGGVGVYRGGVHSSSEADPGTGGEILAGFFKTGDGSFLQTSTVTGTLRVVNVVATSDRDSKTGFEPVDAKAILAKVATMPVSSWVYKHEGVNAVRHIGPVSQDFSAAFGVGQDDKTISVVDAGGVAFAAIKGLNDLLKEKEAQIAKLERDLNAIKARLGL